MGNAECVAVGNSMKITLNMANLLQAVSSVACRDKSYLNKMS
ncbi:MAG: hypothetical protein ACLU70_01605 [Lachnospira sp.]